MRQKPTEAEQLLWRILRDRRFTGRKFRRQVPMGDYIVDFYSASSNLIVELDGSQHAENSYDAARDAWLRASGYRVLRIWNNQLTGDRNAVLDAVWHALEEKLP